MNSKDQDEQQMQRLMDALQPEVDDLEARLRKKNQLPMSEQTKSLVMELVASKIAAIEQLEEPKQTWPHALFLARRAGEAALCRFINASWPISAWCHAFRALRELNEVGNLPYSQLERHQTGVSFIGVNHALLQAAAPGLQQSALNNTTAFIALDTDSQGEGQHSPHVTLKSKHGREWIEIRADKEGEVILWLTGEKGNRQEPITLKTVRQEHAYAKYDIPSNLHQVIGEKCVISCWFNRKDFDNK